MSVDFLVSMELGFDLHLLYLLHLLFAEMVEVMTKVAILERERWGWGRNYRGKKEGGGRLGETGGEGRLG